MTVDYDDTICVRCAACVTESECGGVTLKDGKIRIDESRAEDWANIVAICPVGALKLRFLGRNLG